MICLGLSQQFVKRPHHRNYLLYVLHRTFLGLMLVYCIVAHNVKTPARSQPLTWHIRSGMAKSRPFSCCYLQYINTCKIVIKKTAVFSTSSTNESRSNFELCSVGWLELCLCVVAYADAGRGDISTRQVVNNVFGRRRSQGGGLHRTHLHEKGRETWPQSLSRTRCSGRCYGRDRELRVRMRRMCSWSKHRNP